MNVRRLAGPCVCALVIASLGGGAARAHAAAVTHRAVGYAAPARDRTLRHGTGSEASRNWAGYAAFNSTGTTDFNSVKAVWVQPTVKCEAKSAWAVFWVGLDGWGNNTVEQGGSSARCINGVPHYALWWEMFPTNAIQTVLSINPGDRIRASVTYKPATRKFVIRVKDLTSGLGFTHSPTCASDQVCNRASAEVIAEDVGRFGAGTYFPLADYGKMRFNQSTITDVNGTSGGFSDPAWQYAAITEQDSTTIYATVSALFNNGKAFNVTWKHR